MKNSKRIVLILCFIFFIVISFISPAAAGENNNVYTLDKSITEALKNNYNIKVEAEKIEEAVFKRKQATADFLPKLSTSYSYTRLHEVARSTVTPARDLNSLDNYQWNTTVTQTLFAGFAIVSAYKLSKLGIDISNLNMELAKQSLILNVKNAYFNILKADKGVEVAASAVESLESHVREAQSFYDVGMIPVNDLLKADVELANARHNLTKVRNISRLARATFNIQLSRSVNDPVEVEDIQGYKPEKFDFEECLKNAMNNRPEIRTIDINILQIDQQIRIAKSGHYPVVALSYDYLKKGNKLDVDGSAFHDANSWQATAVLSWTLWDWRKTSNTVRASISQKRQMNHTKTIIEDNIRLEVKNAILGLEEAEKNIPTTKKALEQAEENLRVSRERYKAQVSTSTEVLDAQTLLTQVKSNYYSALYDNELAKAALKRAMGEN